MSTLADWDPTKPLEPGRMLLEASAGTGKTYNLTNWVIRLVAEYDVAIREIVVVTFTRAATAELKERIRNRLSDVLAVLEGRSEADPEDPVMQLIVNGAAEASQRGQSWLRRLRDAQEAFDECLISTIHGFCQRMLQQNAFEAQTDFDLELVEDTSGLRSELVDDWLSSELHADDPTRYQFLVQQCGFDQETLSSIAGVALDDSEMAVAPSKADVPTADDWPAEREAFAQRWNGGWAMEVEQLYEDARQDGVFTKRQRTYTKPAVAKKVAALSSWLEAEGDWSQAIPGLGFFSIAGPAKQLADGKEAPWHASFDALVELASFSDRLVAGHRARFIHWLRVEFDARNQARRTQSYADLMRRLADVLGRDPSDPGRSALVAAVGSRYRVALIDEFQDTDAQQWTIFRALFAAADQRLYLIGDPKQAIYAFRGANVNVYLKARRDAGPRVATMLTNYRSDQRLIDALNHVMDREGLFGESGIEYVKVQAATRADAPVDRVQSCHPWTDPGSAPLQLRFVDQRITGAETVSDDDPRVSKGVLGTLLPESVANDIVRLLQSGTRLFEGRDPETGDDLYRPVGPSDIAVLTRTGREACAVQDALGGVAVPSVLQGEDSVLASAEAFDLQLWLDALASPGRDGPARSAATSRLFGRDAALLARLDAEEPAAITSWEAWTERLANWRKRFEEQGFLPTLRRALEEDLLTDAESGQEADVTARILRRADGERRLTNLWHVAELVHGAESADRLRLPGLLTWLRQQRAETTVDTKTAEMRLERDDEAVKVLTMHKSKGLQFNFVFAPFLWGARLPSDKDAIHVVPTDDDPAERICDVRQGAAKAGTISRAKDESREETLRVFYVALTRAKFRCIVHLGHINDLENAAIGPVFHGHPTDAPDEPATRLARGVARASEGTPRSELWNDLLALAADSGSTIDGAPSLALTHCDPPTAVAWPGVARAEQPLAARDFIRSSLDSTWRRYSYTALTRDKATTYVNDEREGFDGDAEIVDRAVAGVVDPWAPEYDLSREVPDVPLAEFPGGADAGTFLHEVFERADFRWAQPDGPTEDAGGSLAKLLGELLPGHGFEPERWTEMLRDGLLEVLRTPLGGPIGDVRLCDVAREQRLDELRFDFPIAGGGRFGRGDTRMKVSSEALVAALMLRLNEKRAPDDEATMRGAYLRGLGHFGNMAGFMTGSIDLVFRHAVNGVQQWFVVDYKSNRLDPQGRRRWPVQHFGREGMRYEMEQHHYYLQYHLYVLALHRYLRSRLGGAYDYERDLGGAYYLFFRGMIGADTPRVEGHGHGCFFDKPPWRVIQALDQLFADPAAFEGVMA